MHSISSLVPRPPRPAFVACSTKSGEKAWMDLSCDACCCWRHVQSAYIWACSLPFTLLPLNYFCSVCPASPIATGSIVASYSTWHQQRHASCDKSVQAFSPLFVLQATKAGHGRPGNKATASAQMHIRQVHVHCTCIMVHVPTITATLYVLLSIVPCFNCVYMQTATGTGCMYVCTCMTVRKTS